MLETHWRTRHPIGLPSQTVPASLANLRRHQARVVAQWRSRTSELDALPWIEDCPLCPCGETQSSEHALLNFARFAGPRRILFDGLISFPLFDEFMLCLKSVFPLLRFLRRCGLFAGSDVPTFVLLQDLCLLARVFGLVVGGG